MEKFPTEQTYETRNKYMWIMWKMTELFKKNLMDMYKKTKSE